MNKGKTLMKLIHKYRIFLSGSFAGYFSGGGLIAVHPRKETFELKDLSGKKRFLEFDKLEHMIVDGEIIF